MAAGDGGAAAGVSPALADQLFVKGVVAYARSDFDLSALNGGNGGLWSDYMWSFRARLMYLF